VHDELTALLATGGPLHAPPETVRDYLDNDDLIDEYRQTTKPGAIEGRAMVLTAGPPGAGKSTTLAALRSTYRVIDPDEIKDLLLDRLQRRLLLTDLRRHTLPDGQPVRPGEVATWVHRTSTDIGDAVRAVSLALGGNFVMEGTLRWEGTPQQYARELDRNDYQYLEIIDVEVPRTTARRQARERWWRGRNDASLSLGGRFIADSVIDDCYDTNVDLISICARHARDLYEEATDMLVAARLRTLVRDHQGAARTATIDADGASRWDIPGVTALEGDRGFGARCVRCGRLLTNARSIEIGLGEECRRA
jgi:energy-coupling factor transporter ATP-binding protein EcfA2